MIGSPFKPRAHYVFDYKPRYYDPRKERLEKLRKSIEDESKKSDVPGISLSKEKLKKDWARHKKSTSDRGTSFRLAIIIAILVGLVAYFFEIHKLF